MKQDALVSLFCILFFLPTPGRSFSSPEHLWLGNTALKIALEYYETHRESACPLQELTVSEIRELFPQNTARNESSCPISYGHITEKADFIANPLHLLSVDDPSGDWILGSNRIARSCKQLNRNTIRNPDLIITGQVISLPHGGSSQSHSACELLLTT